MQDKKSCIFVQLYYNIIAFDEKNAAKYKKQFKIDCFTSTEMDIIEKLESVPNKAGYIKSLIRKDIEENK